MPYQQRTNSLFERHKLLNSLLFVLEIESDEVDLPLVMGMPLGNAIAVDKGRFDMSAAIVIHDSGEDDPAVARSLTGTAVRRFC